MSFENITKPLISENRVKERLNK